MSREEMFKGDIKQCRVYCRHCRKRNCSGLEGHLSPTYTRLVYWARAVQLVAADYMKAIAIPPNRKRKYPKTEQSRVYLAALLALPILAGDRRLAGYPLSMERSRQLTVNVMEGYRETVGLIRANADFPTWTGTVFNARHLAERFEPLLEKLVRRDMTIDEVLDWIAVEA